MLAHHTKESMTIDDLLDAIDKLDGGHIPVDKLRMEQQLLWFIAQWEKDFNEHLDADIMRIISRDRRVA